MHDQTHEENIANSIILSGFQEYDDMPSQEATIKVIHQMNAVPLPPNNIVTIIYLGSKKKARSSCQNICVTLKSASKDMHNEIISKSTSQQING